MRKAVLNAVFVAIIVSFLTSTVTVADVYLKNKQHSDGFAMMGQKQEPKDTIQEVWIAEDKVAQISGEQTILMRLDRGTVYFIDHKEKKYTEMPMNMNNMMEEMTGGRAEETAAMKNMMQNMMKMNISVTNTVETKKINNWNCVKYIEKIGSAMAPMTIEAWNTEDIKIDANLYTNFTKAALVQMPGMVQGMEDIAKELKKMKGITVYSTTAMSMMGTEINSTSELLEWKEGKAPTGTFEVPAGYTKGQLIRGMPNR